MIRQISINIPQFIYNWIPVHRRKANWVKFLQVISAAFTTMMAEYKEWRNASITRAYVSSQTISMEWYLNELYDNTLRRIEIVTGDVSGVLVALQSEAIPFILAGLQSEPGELGDFQYMPLPFEDVTTGTADFIVRVPLALTWREGVIKRVVNNYKLAGKTYTIVYF